MFRLIGINAAQLVVALISNLFLLLNMARRVRFAIAQPIIIIGWYARLCFIRAVLTPVKGTFRLLYSLH
jgi:hypothetical protein